MTLYRLGGLAAVSKLPQRPRRARSIGWFAARFAWAAIALLIIGSLGEAVRAQTQETVPVEIRFDRGASSKAISASVIRGERSLYSIGARVGQRLTLSISSVEDNAVFQVYAPGAQPKRADYGVEISGTALPGAAEGQDAKSWSGILPQSGAYLIAVGPTRGNATYTLTVTIR